MDGPVSERIVVTGASSGIGRELAIQLAKPGCEIWLIGRDETRLAEVAGKVTAKGGVARTVSMDLADIDAAGNFLTGTFPDGGRVDAVYLSAAVSLFGELQNTLPEDWDELYRTNLLSPVQWTHYFYKAMVGRGAGRIVLISSLAGYAGYPSATIYATMKGGLLGLFRSLWHEARRHGVAIHLVSPGYVRTRIYEVAKFRRTSYEKTMEIIGEMGFGMEEPDAMAAAILEGIRRGKSDFALPGYASLMKWVAPRMPWVVGLMHDRMMQRFRSKS